MSSQVRIRKVSEVGGEALPADVADRQKSPAHRRCETVTWPRRRCARLSHMQRCVVARVNERCVHNALLLMVKRKVLKLCDMRRLRESCTHARGAVDSVLPFDYAALGLDDYYDEQQLYYDDIAITDIALFAACRILEEFSTEVVQDYWEYSCSGCCGYNGYYMRSPKG